MAKEHSTKWKSSKKARKQRKYQYNASLHTRRKMVASHLSAELRKKHGKRALPVRVGDSVKIVRGQLKGKRGKIERIKPADMKIFITGIETTKRDGSKVLVPVRPSNLIIETLNLDDKKRLKRATPAETPAPKGPVKKEVSEPKGSDKPAKKEASAPKGAEMKKEK